MPSNHAYDAAAALQFLSGFSLWRFGHFLFVNGVLTFCAIISFTSRAVMQSQMSAQSSWVSLLDGFCQFRNLRRAC
jgi:hypothetical protein